MKRGRPAKSAKTTPKRARSRSAKVDAAASLNRADPDAAALIDGPPPAKPKTKRPGRGHGKGLVALLLDDERLDAGDCAAIRMAHKGGLTVQDVSALVVYEIRLAQRLFASGDITATGLMISLGKANSRAAAAAQLAATAGGAALLPREVKVQMGDAVAPSAVGKPGHELATEAKMGLTGHRMDVET